MGRGKTKMLDFDFFFQQNLVGLDLNVSWAPICTRLRSSQREKLGSVCFEQAHFPLCHLCSFVQSLGCMTINPGLCHFGLTLGLPSFSPQIKPSLQGHHESLLSIVFSLSCRVFHGWHP